MKNIIKKIQEYLDILEAKYTEDEDKYNYSEIILEGLKEEPDYEYKNVIEDKISRTDLIKDLIYHIEKKHREAIKSTIKAIKEHNQTLEGGDYSEEEEASQEIIKLAKQAQKKLGN